MNLFGDKVGSRANIEPRYYQLQDHDESFRLWDGGEVGVLTRSATGSGKTVMACLKGDTWLQRGDDYRVMVISYETQLVWQFAQEIEDVLGIRPGIEMDKESVDADYIPKIVVVSRASLLRAPVPTPEQTAELLAYGISDLGPSPARACKRFLDHLRKNGNPEEVRDEIERLKTQPEADGKHWSRLHKFDWQKNWLLIFDEAHRHAHHLASVGHIVDWFDRNPSSRRNGITATPKRADDVSIGDKMFPGIALDYPLYSPTKPCAVKDGFAVPYIQKYIEVEGVDFRSLAKMGSDFDEAELEKILGQEEQLAKLVEPLLDMVESRQTLIFNPGVEMAKNVARYINARSETVCECGKRKWFANLLIGDGATCACGRLIDPNDITLSGEQARELDGSSSPEDRKQTYVDFQEKKFQFLSVCGLCREGYNNPDVSCVACFRPISQKASSLAEQLKGRGCRTLRGILDGLKTAEERLAAIAASAKPNCIAKGTPILTDQGLIAIEKVTTAMKVWDGLEFVTHSGIISRGYQRVITYAGLTATPDHEVMIHDEENPASEVETWTTIGDAAAKQTPIRVTGIGWKAVREADRYYRRDRQETWRDEMQAASSYRMQMRRESIQGLLGIDCRNEWLPKMRSAREISALALAKVFGGSAEMPKSERQGLCTIRRTWDCVRLPYCGGNGNLGEGQPWTSQGTIPGSHRQQRQLRSWKFAVCETDDSNEQPSRSPSYPRGSCVSYSASRNTLFAGSLAEIDPARFDVETNHRQAQQSRWNREGAVQGEVEVFDIVNAGPRHRFTAAGLLVSNCLVVDLVGITGLADCASTVQIYAEGLADCLKDEGHDEDEAARIAAEIAERAAEILLEGALDQGEMAVEEAVAQAKREDDEARAKVRAEREAAEARARDQAERRAKAGAEVKYTEHEVGYGSQIDPDAASDKQYNYANRLGMKVNALRSKRQIGRIIDMLLQRMPLEEVARLNRLDADQWEASKPSLKQINFMKWKHVPTEKAKTPHDASLLIDAKLEGEKFVSDRMEAMSKAKTADELTVVAKDIRLVNGVLSPSLYAQLISAGKDARQRFVSDDPIPD